MIDVREIEELLGDIDNPARCESVGEFLKRMPCTNLTLDDKNRFGEKVKRTADGLLQIPFMARKHDDLVALRVYPTPLLEWLYTKLFDVRPTPLDDPREREVRRHESTRKQLESGIEHAPEPVQNALNVVLEWLDTEIKRMRAVNGDSKPGVPHLRPI